MNNSDKNTNFELNQNNSVNEKYKLNSTEKYRSKSVKISTIIFIFAMFVVAIGLIFKEGERSLPPGSSYSYLEGTDYTKGDIKVKGVQLKIYQDSGEGYQDVTSTGFDLNTKTFATDVRYNYDLIIKNDEKATVTADQYYLRWNFIALVDNQEYDITDYCKVDTAFVYKQKDSDGKTRFYSVSGTSANTISAQNQLAFLSSIRFDGVYDNLTHKYGSILDNEFSGSKIKIIANIEGSLTPYDIILPTVKFYDSTGNVEFETEVSGDNTITTPGLGTSSAGTVIAPGSTTTTSITTPEGETLYFQGWIKNGNVAVVYSPNEEVEYNLNDVFTPYYAVDPDYSTTFAYTQDPVTGEFTISGVNKNATDITIPAIIQGQPVTMVNNKAFYSYTTLKTVTMPQTITKIGDYAFYNCQNLTEINIPNAVQSIGVAAFSNCYYLTKINIPASTTYIGSKVLYYTMRLSTITVDENNPNYSAENNILYNKEKTKLIRAGINTINPTIPNTVKTIEFHAFYRSNSSSLTLPEGVETLEASAFSQSWMVRLNLPSTLKDINNSFSEMFGIENINISSENQNFTKVGKVLFSSDMTRLIRAEVNITGDYVIPDSVTTLDEGAFYYCQKVNTISIGAGIKEISYSFGNNSSITSITIPSNINRISRYAFHGSGITSVTFEDTTNWYATTNSSYTGGTSIDVTSPATNATNLKTSGSWDGKYLYQK